MSPKEGKGAISGWFKGRVGKIMIKNELCVTLTPDLRGVPPQSFQNTAVILSRKRCLVGTACPGTRL